MPSGCWVASSNRCRDPATAPGATTRTEPSAEVSTFQIVSPKPASIGPGSGQSRAMPSTSLVSSWRSPTYCTPVIEVGLGRTTCGVPVSASYNRVELSDEPAANCVPSGLKATEFTQLAKPVNGSPICRIERGLLTSQIRAARLFSPDASRSPVWSNATLKTKSVGSPTDSESSSRAAPLSGADHSRMVPSELPAAKTFAVGE